MAEAMVEGLSEPEQKCLEHIRQARELGVSLAEYCRSFDLHVNEWYRIKQGLARKGVPEAGGAKVKAPKVVDDEPASFARVHIAAAPVVLAPPAPAAVTVPVACRIVHPSGWVVECGTLPQAAWLAAVLAGQRP